MSRRRLVRICLSLIVFAVISLLGLNVTRNGTDTITPPSSGGQPGTYPVTHVTDGDTFDVKIAGKTEIVRLIGIDTPETHDRRKNVQCYGQEAATEAHHLLDGQNVRLVGDPQDSDRDKYHRLLRYAYLPDGTLYNQHMVEQGYAFAYVIFPNEKLNEFKSWQTEAKAAGRGIWSHCQIHLDGQIEQTNAVGPPPT